MVRCAFAARNFAAGAKTLTTLCGWKSNRELLFCPSGAWSFTFGRGMPARGTCGRLEDTMMLPGMRGVRKS
jgi:hypothetical protein